MTPRASRLPPGECRQVALPAPARIGGKGDGRARVAGCEGGPHLIADLKMRRRNRRAQPGQQLRGAPPQASSRWPSARPPPVRASPHGPRPPQTRPGPRTAPACNPPPAWRIRARRGARSPHPLAPAAVCLCHPARAHPRRGPARARRGPPAGPAGRAHAARFSRTAAALSPTCAPRFSEANAPALTPPSRSVKCAWTAARCCPVRRKGTEGAGLAELTRAASRVRRAAPACLRAAALPSASRGPSRDA